MNTRVSRCALMALLLLATPAARAARHHRSSRARRRIRRERSFLVSTSRFATRTPACSGKPSAPPTAPTSSAAIVPGTTRSPPNCRGSRSTHARDVRLEVGKTASLDVDMAVGGIEETVTVSAESPIVDVTSKEVGGNITARELVELPSVNRNFVGFVGLLPGIIPEHQHGVVRQRLGHRQRPGSAQQQLHARRRQQQRRRDRAARGNAGADADRIGAGVPGASPISSTPSSAAPTARSSTP